jgi:hypothetical protein
VGLVVGEVVGEGLVVDFILGFGFRVGVGVGMGVLEAERTSWAEVEDWEFSEPSSFWVWVEA